MQDSNPKPNNNPDRESYNRLSQILERHFPHPMEETELVLLEVSPHRLHAYWHITPWDLRAAGVDPQSKDQRLVMRFHDLTQGAAKTHPTFDIEIHETTGSRYIEVWEDAKSYHAVLGVFVADRGLIDLARSNTVELPQAGRSTKSGSRILTLTPLADDLFTSSSTATSGIDINAAPAKENNQAESIQLTDATLQRGLKSLFPLFPDPGAPIFAPRMPELESLTAAVEATPIPRSAPGPSPLKPGGIKAQETESPELTNATLQHGLKPLPPLFPNPGTPIDAPRTPELESPRAAIEATPAPSPGPSPPEPGDMQAEVTGYPQSAGKTSPESATQPGSQGVDINRSDRFPLCSIADAWALAKADIIPLPTLNSLRAAAAQVPSGFAFAPLGRTQTRPATSTGRPASLVPEQPTSAWSQTLSSFSLTEGRVQDEELHVELRIHGRSQPNSHILISDQVITTRADGSFSLQIQIHDASRRLVTQLLTASQPRES